MLPCPVLPCLTCEVDSDSHDDDNDAQDDEGDAKQPCQAAQPPCPIQVPLLHTTSRLQREREGRETSGSLSISRVGMEAIQYPGELLPTPHLPCHPQSRRLLQDRWPVLLADPSLRGQLGLKDQAMPGASSQGRDRAGAGWQGQVI